MSDPVVAFPTTAAVLILVGWWLLLAFFAVVFWRSARAIDDDLAAMDESLDHIEAMVSLNKGWRNGGA